MHVSFQFSFLSFSTRFFLFIVSRYMSSFLLFPFFLLSFLNNLYYISISSLIPLSCFGDHPSLIDGVPKIVCNCNLYFCMSVHSFPTGFLTRFRGSVFSIEYKSLCSQLRLFTYVNRNRRVNTLKGWQVNQIFSSV